jgi:putative ABC transport system permease protein
MKYLPLVLAGLWRKPTRMIFTALSIVVAFILFGILSGIDAGFAHQVDISRLDRMYVASRFANTLPYAYGEKVASLPGVLVVSPQAGLGGYYQLRKNQLAVTATDARYFSARPELAVTPQQIAALKADRAGVLVGVKSARLYGWKLGDKIAINTSTPQQNGSLVWTFDMLGTLENTDLPGEAVVLIGNYNYVDDARMTDKGTVGYFLVRVKDPAQAAAIGKAIDGLFANSPAPTRTILEKADATASLQSLGDVETLTRGVGGAVLFMLLFLTGNTMMQSVRERIPEFGVLKTLGFSDAGVLILVLSEALLLCALAAGVGLAIVKLAFPMIKKAVPQVSALLLLPWSALAIGFCCALLVAFISGFWPALRVKRLNVVDALAGR